MSKEKDLFEEAEEISLPSSDDEEGEGGTNDFDTCSAVDLEQFFRTKYRKSDEFAVKMQKEYVLKLCVDSSFTRLAAGLSNGEVQLFDIRDERSLNRAFPERILPSKIETGAKKKRRVNICGIQFLDDNNPNCLLIGTTNGLVRLVDLRTNQVVANFEENIHSSRTPDPGIKKILCFERNANGRILCTGTEKCQNAVYIIFYDIRQRKQCGAYFDSHEEDVTSLRFHPRNPDLLCSGSTDGLINIFDIKQSNEDDALLTTFNTESSVQKLNWHTSLFGKDIISSISHTDFKAYHCDEREMLIELDREKITSTMKRNDPSNCNLINAHNMDDNGVFLLAGTNFNKGEVMRALHMQSKDVLPFADFDGNQQIVRESVFNFKNGSLITAGESGLITLWTPESLGQEGQLISASNELKSKTKHKSTKINPY